MEKKVIKSLLVEKQREIPGMEIMHRQVVRSPIIRLLTICNISRMPIFF